MEKKPPIDPARRRPRSFGIEAVASARHRVRVDVAGEDLQFDVALRGVDLLAKQHGEGIGLFAGAAAGDPDPQRPIQMMVAHEVGNDALLQELEDRRVAKETRDVDQQVAGELIALVRVAKQEVKVGIHVGGEDLQFDIALRGVDLLAKKHRERISLLAGAAAGDPHPFRATRRRPSARRRRGDGRGGRRSVRCHFQAAPHLPSRWRRRTRRFGFVLEHLRWLPATGAPEPGVRAFAPDQAC